MIKRMVLIVIGLLVVGLFSMESWLGVSPWRLRDNLVVVTAMGAKLACSGHHLSGLNAEQALADVASYSPAANALNIEYDDAQGLVSADLFGLSLTRAQYRPGLGCTLDIGDTSALDTVVVPEFAAEDRPWPAGSQVDTIDPQRQAQLTQMLLADNEAGLKTRALLMVEDGHIVAESYAPGFDAFTPLMGWSMGKSLSAIMLGHLELQGKLNVQQDQLFAAWAEDERSAITIENLLHMSSGLGFEEIYAPGSDATHMLFAAHAASSVPLASELAHPPGKKFYYSSGTTNLLQQLLFERLGGTTQRSVDYLYQEIFQPLAIAHTVLEPDPSGVFVGSSYIYASGRDWARMGQLMLAGGELNGVRLLSEDWVRRSALPNHSDNDRRYGYQFWLNQGGAELRWPQLPEDAYAMMGNRQQNVMVVPSRRAVLVRLGWTNGAYPLDDNFSALLNAQLKAQEPR
jgi:CubicO group peptidase (beta-lactamase class C family)